MTPDRVRQARDLFEAALDHVPAGDDQLAALLPANQRPQERCRHARRLARPILAVWQDHPTPLEWTEVGPAPGFVLKRRHGRGFVHSPGGEPLARVPGGILEGLRKSRYCRSRHGERCRRWFGLLTARRDDGPLVFRGGAR